MNPILKVLVFTLIGLSLTTWRGAFIPTATDLDSQSSPQEETRYFRTRFNRLTSKVWRLGEPFRKADLKPIQTNNPHPEPQPKRDHPERITLEPTGRKAYITLAGTEAHPSNEIAVIDIANKKVLRRIQVGSRPYMTVMHPQGRFLVVINAWSNYASVIDVRTDENMGIIPLDFYCQGLVFSKDGKQAWVANRYLDQVLVLSIWETEDTLHGAVLEQGGFNKDKFYGKNLASVEINPSLKERGYSDSEIRKLDEQKSGGINSILRSRCASCHKESAGGFLSGPDPTLNFLSAVENSIGGKPFESPLLRAVLPRTQGGFGDQRHTAEYHPGGVLFSQDDEDLKALVDWILKAEGGPGIPVSNPGSHPKDLSLSQDGKMLFVGNTGTQDLSIIDTGVQREIGGIFIQNLASHILLAKEPETNRELLLILSMGAGFGAPKSRDPQGGETWDRMNRAAQFTVLRDFETTDSYPLENQHVMGPYDAVDGTWNFKMRDIQNDLIAVDTSKIDFPTWTEGMPLNYLLRANRYEAHPHWVRYTSDTAEATTGDIKGDIPPELQRVHGAFPEWAALKGDRLYVSMAGSFEVVEWKIHWNATEASDLLEPLRTFKTGLRPVGIALGLDGTASEGLLLTANQLSETVSLIHLDTGKRQDIIVGNLTRPALDTDAEKGELVVHSSIFTSDGDTSCLHCHYRDTGDGRGWGAAETVGQDHFGHLTPGGTLGIPQMRNVFTIQPYYFEGTHLLGEGQGADINEPASSIDFDRPVWTGDFSSIKSPVPENKRRILHEELKERVEIRKLGSIGYDLEERRNEFMRRQSMQVFGEAHSLADLYRYVSAWLGNTPHLVPNPMDQEHPSVKRGARLFNSASVMCGVCHQAPDFTSKDALLTHNERRALPTLTSISRRDASYTLVSVHAMEVANGRKFDLDPGDRGRVEEREGSFTTMQLRGIFDRPPVFLHHGQAKSLREVICTPQHKALRTFTYPIIQGMEEIRPQRKEIGFNEVRERTKLGNLDSANQIVDSHGGTSQLSPRQVEDLIHFMEAIQ
jgi:hypothetical protein